MHFMRSGDDSLMYETSLVCHATQQSFFFTNKHLYLNPLEHFYMINTIIQDQTTWLSLIYIY